LTSLFASRAAEVFTQDLSCKALVESSCEAIFARRIHQPKVAIVLGSGLGELAQHVEHAEAIDYAALPCFPRTHAAGHAGNLITGYLAGMPVALMQGRAHRYEGFTDTELSLPIHCLHSIGARTLIVTNAAGGLNPRFCKGDLMLIEQHLDFLWATPHSRTVGHRAYAMRGGNVGNFQCDVPMRGSSPYDYDLISRARRVARREDIELQQGTYLSTLGPTYETRGEYRMFRAFGADAVGMSTIPEVVAARQLDMRVLAFSVITNVASTDVPQSTNHQEVIDVGMQAGPRLLRIVCGVLSDLAGQPD
jgi:purine-nucleoside phosphorylase